MPRQTLVGRVERLEERVTALEQLPARIDELASQVSQLRTEVRDGFSATDAKLQYLRDDLGRQMRILHEDLIERIKALGDGRPNRKR